MHGGFMIALSYLKVQAILTSYLLYFRMYFLDSYADCIFLIHYPDWITKCSVRFNSRSVCSTNCSSESALTDLLPYIMR